MNQAYVQEKLSGIVSIVKYHNPTNGWPVLKIEPLSRHRQSEAVTVHNTKIFAGAKMEFIDEWQQHSKFGRQFKANKAIERKPVSVAYLEKHLGSGLIKELD